MCEDALLAQRAANALSREGESRGRDTERQQPRGELGASPSGSSARGLG